jgi:3-dehydroquinate synthetase
LGERCAIITDSNVGPRYADAAIRALKMAGFVPSVVTVSAGEGAKSLKVLGECYDQLAMKRLERRSFVVALGGGCVGDLAGFVAATYLRGIPYVQVATTLLAQVDSSVGGKVGINLKSGKNLVGAFHQPRTVLCDLDTLSSLPDREFRAGMAEVVKYGVIREIVGADEYETTGVRAVLNFGHTVGHGIEALSGYNEFIHGEAVSLGTVAAARLSSRLMSFPDKEADRIRDLLQRIGLPTVIKFTPKKREALFDAMRLDKKVSGGELKFVLAKSMGDVVPGQRVPDAEINAVLNLIAE